MAKNKKFLFFRKIGSKTLIPSFSYEQFIVEITSKNIENNDLINVESSEKIDSQSDSVFNQLNNFDQLNINNKTNENEAETISKMENLVIINIKIKKCFFFSLFFFQLCQTFLAAIRYQLIDNNKCKLPINVGQFYANFILKNIPNNIHIDIKKTKYKKFITFLNNINNELIDNNNENDNWIVKIINKNNVDLIEKANFKII